MDFVSSLANLSPVVAIVVAFIWYLHTRDKRDQKIHDGYQRHISDLTIKMDGHGTALQSIYKYSISREELLKEYDVLVKQYSDTIKRLTDLVERYENHFFKSTKTLDGKKKGRS